MPISIGSVLNQYQITALLGEGGMGTVYRARDKKLKRDVAIKILPAAFAADPASLGRFQREAEALASLSHANIAAIHDIQECDGTTFLVLELVEGETLERIIELRRSLPVSEVLTISRQICAALAAAHERGIVHRDLKPSNIKLTADRVVKLLDFGVARVLEEIKPADGISETRAMTRTEAGSVMGTPTYMAPEQARAESVDGRADLWALGCVIFEMLTGQPPFKAPNVADTFSLIVSAEPDWAALPRGTPIGLTALLRQCLQKDRHKRLAHAADALIIIEDIIANPSVTVDAAPAQAASRSALTWTGWAAAMIAALLATAVWLWSARTPVRETLKVFINTPPTSDGFSLALSPDGRSLVYPVVSQGRPQLWLRRLDSLTPTLVIGSDGGTFPFWSPDGSAIGFFAEGQLKHVNVNGGVPVGVARTALPRGATWNRDNIILFAPSGTGPLSRVPASGGTPVVVTTLDAGHMSHRFPQFLADGEHFIFFAAGSEPGIFVAALSGGPAKRVVNTEASGVVSSDRLFFVREGALFSQSFDTKALALRDQPVPVAEQVAVDSGAFLGGFTAAGTQVAYRTGGAGGRRQLQWFDRSGKMTETVGAPDTSVLTGTEVSPDGRRVAVNRMLNGNLDIWLIDVHKGALSRISFAPTLDAWPHWTADGNRLVFSANVTGAYNLYERLASSAGEPRLLFDSDQAKIPLDVSPDGKLLAFASLDSSTGFDLWTISLVGPASPKILLKTPFQESGAQFDPVGRWLAYHSNESGRYEVYVQSLDGAPGRIQVSSAGGAQARWRRDGKEIFFVSLDGYITAAPVSRSRSGGLEIGAPAPLFPVEITGGPVLLNNTAHYWPTPDGQRFLVNVSIDPTPPITLLYNWTPTTAR